MFGAKSNVWSKVSDNKMIEELIKLSLISSKGHFPCLDNYKRTCI